MRGEVLHLLLDPICENVIKYVNIIDLMLSLKAHRAP